MAEFRDLYDEIQAAGAGVAALAVDEPARSEKVRQEYALPFPILCDTQHAVVQAWDLYNRKEKGGLAEPATFLIEAGNRVRFASRDGHASRVRAEEMLRLLRGDGASALAGGPSAPRKRIIFPTLHEWLRSAWPAVRLSLFPPKK